MYKNIWSSQETTTASQSTTGASVFSAMKLVRHGNQIQNHNVVKNEYVFVISLNEVWSRVFGSSIKNFLTSVSPSSCNEIVKRFVNISAKVLTCFRFSAHFNPNCCCFRCFFPFVFWLFSRLAMFSQQPDKDHSYLTCLRGSG